MRQNGYIVFPRNQALTFQAICIKCQKRVVLESEFENNYKNVVSLKFCPACLRLTEHAHLSNCVQQCTFLYELMKCSFLC